MALLKYQNEFFEKLNKKSTTVSFISVYVGTKGYLLRLDNVFQIGKFQNFSRLGLEKDWFKGVATIDNEIVSVIDLGVLLKSEEKSSIKDLVRLQEGNRKNNWALGVERIGALISQQELQPLKGETSDFISRDYFWNKTGEYEPEILSEIDFSALFSNEDLKTVFKG